MRTHWELKGNSGNTLGTREKWKKKSSSPTLPPPPPKLKRKKKKARHIECMHGSSPWLHQISFPKRVGHHFWPEIVPLAKKNTLLGVLIFYLFCFILFSLGVPHKSNFFFFLFSFFCFAMSQFDWPITNKKKKRS
jgi:hypothetical protein